MEEGKEVAGGFVVASREASALLEPREQTFDVVAFSIQLLVVRIGAEITVGFLANHWSEQPKKIPSP